LKKPCEQSGKAHYIILAQEKQKRNGAQEKDTLKEGISPI
jgi:hypothetical protein